MIYTFIRNHEKLFPIEKKYKILLVGQRSYHQRIGYIREKEGFLYLTAVLDLYDRKFMDCSLSDEMNVEKTSLLAWREWQSIIEVLKKDWYFILTEVFNTLARSILMCLIPIK
jgi:hypothetical protein